VDKTGLRIAGMEKKEAPKDKSAERAQWYNVKRLAQAILRRPQDAARLARRIELEAEGEIRKSG
jgi:hypothetical protein